MWKKFALGNGIFLAAVLIFSCVCMFPTKNAGIVCGSWSTYDQFAEYAADQKVMVLTNTELLSNKEHFLEAMSEGKIGVHYDLEVYIVEALGDDAMQNGATYEQVVNIIDVLQGSAEPKQQITVHIQGGFVIQDGEPLYIGNMNKNLMKPGNRYLIFCEKLEYQDGDYLEYRIIPGLLNVLCVNQDDEPYRENAQITNTWSQYRNRELLTDSNETIEQFNALKEEMFEIWGVDREKYCIESTALPS